VFGGGDDDDDLLSNQNSSLLLHHQYNYFVMIEFLSMASIIPTENLE
jgi:hypothetical protein